jgi:Ca2+-binding EF-hand superfamily protein
VVFELINFEEFAQLWDYMLAWKTAFEQADRDRSGFIDEQELKQALLNFGYRISEATVVTLTKSARAKGKAQPNAQGINFEQFLTICVSVISWTKSFQELDTQRVSV